MKGYWLILGGPVTDQEAQEQYGKLWLPIAKQYNARINPMKVQPLLQEARNTSRVIVVEFPSYEIAKACYEDPAYQKAREFASRASKRDLLILEGDIV